MHASTRPLWRRRVQWVGVCRTFWPRATRLCRQRGSTGQRTSARSQPARSSSSTPRPSRLLSGVARYRSSRLTTRPTGLSRCPRPRPVYATWASPSHRAGPHPYIPVVTATRRSSGTHVEAGGPLMAPIACQSLPLPPLTKQLNIYAARWGVAHCVESEVAGGWSLPSMLANHLPFASVSLFHICQCLDRYVVLFMYLCYVFVFMLCM